MEPALVLPAMIDAVRAASRVCRAVQSTLTAGDAVAKGDKSPVTVADLASQAIVSRRLGAAFPGLPLVGEEDAEILRGDERRALRETVLARVRAEWPEASEDDVLRAIDRGCGEAGATGAYLTLDPIDGTKGFLRREQYAVALALIVDGRLRAGVLGCPNFDGGGATNGGLILHAVRGEGCRAEATGGGPSVAVRVSRTADPADLRLAESVESGHSDRGSSSALRTKLGITADPVRMDSQCKYALLATGGAELYLRTPTDPTRSEWIWDHAAGVICLEEAGGRVTDLDGRALDFSRGRKLTGNRGIVATNGLLHDAVLGALQQA